MWGDEWWVLRLKGREGQGKNWSACLVFCKEASRCQRKAVTGLALWATATVGFIGEEAQVAH